MKRVVPVCLLLGFFAQFAWAEEASRRFPLEQRFVVTYLNGQDFGSRSLTLMVRRDPAGRGWRGTGFAGCNTWFGRVDIGEAGRFAVGDLGTTRKFCHRDRMKAEVEFLTILRSLSRWRMDGRNLMLTGDKSILVLSPPSRTARNW